MHDYTLMHTITTLKSHLRASRIIGLNAMAVQQYCSNLSFTYQTSFMSDFVPCHCSEQCTGAQALLTCTNGDDVTIGAHRWHSLLKCVLDSSSLLILALSTMSC